MVGSRRDPGRRPHRHFLSLRTCLAALGLTVAPWIPFIAVIMAGIATTIAPLPLGLGSFEVTSTATLHLFGVGTEAAFAATMLLRLLVLWLPLGMDLLTLRSVNHAGGILLP